MRKPRPFYHSPIYIDARQERLAAAEQRARQALGLEDSAAYSPAHLKGTFSAGQRHRRGQGWQWRLPVLLSLVVISAAVLGLLLFSH